MATIETRLMKLESVAPPLPPDGARLFAVWNRLTNEAEQKAWLHGLTDDELQALCDSDFNKGSALYGLDWDRLTESELEILANSTESELDEWADHLRATKPDYFSKVNQ